MLSIPAKRLIHRMSHAEFWLASHVADANLAAKYMRLGRRRQARFWAGQARFSLNAYYEDKARECE